MIQSVGLVDICYQEAILDAELPQKEEPVMTKEQQEAVMKMLQEHPEIEERIFGMCSMVKNETGEFTTADSADAFFVKEVRKLGQEILQGWATTQNANYK